MAGTKDVFRKSLRTALDRAGATPGEVSVSRLICGPSCVLLVIPQLQLLDDHLSVYRVFPTTKCYTV